MVAAVHSGRDSPATSRTLQFQKPRRLAVLEAPISAIREASGLDGSAETKQISTLLYCLGEEAEAVLASTNVTAAERKEYKKVLEKHDSFFEVRKNMIYERARFNRRRQQSGETAEQFIMVLYDLAENCNYNDMKE